MHAVEVAFESIDVRGPEPAELSQPFIDLTKRFRFQPVEASLCVDCRFNEPGLPQHAQVLGDRRLRHTKLALDLSHRLFGGDQETQDGSAVGLSDNLEGGFHPLYILQDVYTCQGI